MKTVVLYSNDNQECERIRSLLLMLGGEFLEYKLGTHYDMDQFKTEFGNEAEFPQVAIGSQHVGGMKETLQYLGRNDLL